MGSWLSKTATLGKQICRSVHWTSFDPAQAVSIYLKFDVALRGITMTTVVHVAGGIFTEEQLAVLS